MNCFIPLFFLLVGVDCSEPESCVITMNSTSEIERAELYVWKPEGKVKAAMIFCPGPNGSGESFVNSKGWRTFASQNQIALVGLSFASPMGLTKQGKGYSDVGRESGKILLAAIEKEFRRNDLPLLFYGYSAGARFCTSFLAWKTERVMSWCASGVGTWPDLPVAKDVAPGIVACGEFDAGCCWSSLNYFQTGRKKGYPWAWISLAETGHQQSQKLDDFVRTYFELVLCGTKVRFDEKKFDIATSRPVSNTESEPWEIFLSCLPGNQNLSERWLKIHYP